MCKRIILTAKLVFLSGLILLLAAINGCTHKESSANLQVEFTGGYGQLEVGGPFAGIEFHKSRPLPSRISFYYPVANSIDLSTDYWKRFESLPLDFILTAGDHSDSLGKIAYDYTYTPYQAEFKNVESNLEINFSYNFCEDLPIVVLKIKIRNISNKSSDIELQTHLDPVIHTSHTYSIINPGQLSYNDDSSIATASFADRAADSSLLFIVNSGLMPVKSDNPQGEKVAFTYRNRLAAQGELEIIQLIGMCRINEQDIIIEKVQRDWQKSIKKYEKRVLDYVFNTAYFEINDPVIMQTIQWSKALIASNRHYLDGIIVPMPCPAEYNFFFTHDLLLTGLGAVNYDADYVKKGFLYLKSLTKEDSILAHARYWKDDHYQIEFCNSDNWNHLWFIILASSYLKHSSDEETIRSIFPILKKSLQMMLQNKGENDLMYAKRPDWWDAGNIYGARSYISILMYKALADYVFIADKLNLEGGKLAGYLQLSEKIKSTLVEKLWDEKAGYLLNMIDETKIDRHYYAGSILAVYYNLLDEEKSDKLLETVRKKLLEEKIGVRNAMPPDFHKLGAEYHFQGLEVGLPFVYFNGGVWPHNNIWYVLSLIANNNIEQAKSALKKYMTLNGIMNSPNGIPSFYEYRNTDSSSARYGEIDKPTFLWAGGFFLQAMYQLSGLRENSYNISFSPDLAQGLENTEYDLLLFGGLSRVKFRGEGNFFKEIKLDGKIQNSAIMLSSVGHIDLERGDPERPYLAQANCKIYQVEYDSPNKTLTIGLSGQKQQKAALKIVSPRKLLFLKLNEIPATEVIEEEVVKGVFVYTIARKLEQVDNDLSLTFK